ncbi:nitrate- and nitrite sensing domain-containing protein [Colwelliaceae bacterium 6471]
MSKAEVLKANIFNSKLLFLIAPAVIGLVLFASYVILENIKTQIGTKKINSLIELNIINNNLLHELQKERELSLASYSAPEDNFAERLVIQRQTTDKLITKHQALLQGNLVVTYNSDIEVLLQKIHQKLDRLDNYRQQIDRKSMTEGQQVRFYSSLNRHLIDIILPSIKEANEEEIINLLEVYYHLIQAKELAGLERALVAKVLNKKSFSRTDRNQYISLIALQSEYLTTFSKLASQPLRKFFNLSMEHHDINNMLKTRHTIINSTDKNNFAGDSMQWFDQASSRINQFKVVEDQIVNLLQNNLVQRAKQSKNILIFSILYSLLALALTFAILRQLIKSQVKQAKQQEQLHKFSLVVENTPNAVLITDNNGVIEYTNKQFCEMSGYQQEEVLGKKPKMLLSKDIAQSAYDDIQAALIKGQQWHGELLNHKKDNSLYWARTKVFPVMSDHGNLLQIIALQEDVTEQKAAQEKIKFLANYDELTGLPSLRLGKDRLEQAILAAQRHGLTMAVMFIDLDGFKKINDLYGHAAGDAILKAASIRMVEILRSTDTVARIGGDEFIAVLTNIKDPKIVNKVAEKLVNALNKPFEYQDNKLTISASIGIALSPQNGFNGAELVDKADRAMYDVKKLGKNSFAIYQEK